MTLVDPRIVRLADVLVSYCVGAEQGQVVTVEAAPVAASLVTEVYRRILRAGAHPLVRIALDGGAEERLRHGSDAQLDWVSPVVADDASLPDARIAILGGLNTRAQSTVDPARQARATRARAPYLKTILERTAAGDFRWVATAFPTQAGAQEAGMSLSRYAEHLFAAMLLDRPDPVAAWGELGAGIRQLAERLHGVRELHLRADGTDLRVSVEGRTWIPCDGRLNFPDGEVFTAPVENSAEGVIRFTYPAVFHGRAVEDVRLRFSGGEVVEATAARGQGFLEEMLALDEGARRLGELAFGLNDAVQTFSGETLLDEKIGGTVHLALGEAYSASGGTNTSGLHWDMVCDLRRGGTVHADGELVYRDGRFLEGKP